MKNEETRYTDSRIPNIKYSSRDDMNVARSLLKMGPFGIDYKFTRPVYDLSKEKVYGIIGESNLLSSVVPNRNQRCVGGCFQDISKQSKKHHHHHNTQHHKKRENDIRYRDDRSNRIRTSDDVAAHIMAISIVARAGPIGRT